MKYRKFNGIVLKKQNYKEADQIVSVWTKELGKIRCVAKSLRSSKSKLSGSFQDLTLVEFEVTGSKGLPTLISSKTIKSFNKLKVNLAKTAAAFYAVELILKMTPDEQPNIHAFGLLEEFLSFLNNTAMEENYFAILDNFSLRLLSGLGFSIEFAESSFKIPKHLSEVIQKLRDSNFAQVKSVVHLTDEKQLHKVVARYVEFILERNMRSDQFLNNV